MGLSTDRSNCHTHSCARHLWPKAMSTFMRLGAGMGAASIGAGAYGAHALKAETERMAVWKTAVQYQQVGALALMASTVHTSPRARLIGGGLLFAGTALFSGCNYHYAHEGEKTFSKGAPVGGILMIGGFLGL